MSNPFSLFRKNQKAWIAGLTVAVMIGFGVLPVVMQMMGVGGGPVPGGQSENRIVLTSTAGDLRVNDLRQLAYERQIINRFYQEVWRMPGPPSQLPIDDERLGDTFLLSEKAKQWGIVVSDAAINRHIQEISDNQLSGKDIQAAIRKIRSDRGNVTDAMLFDALRHQMMANRAADLIFGLQTDQNNFGDTPAEMWEYYQQLNRKLEIEAFAVKVEDFLEEVSKPDDAELAAFFEKYKNRRAGKENVEGAFLDSPVPGFYQPARSRFQYIVADWDSIHQSITDDEIKKYYEENKDTDFLDDLFEDEPKDDPEDQKKEGTEGEDKEPGDKESGDKESEDKEPGDKEKPEETKEPGEPKDPEKTDDEKPETPAEPKKPEKDPAEDPKKPDATDKPEDGDQSLNTRSGTSLPTGTEGEESGSRDAEGEKEASEDGDKADPKKDGEDETGKDPPAEEESKKPADDGDKKEDDKKDGNEKEDTEKPDDKKSDEEDDKKDTEKPKKYMPLESVRDKIRDTLASERVQELQEKGFKELIEEMSMYNLRFTNWNKPDADEKDKPKNPLTEELVKKHGLTLTTTPWLSATELSEVPGFGKSRVTTAINFRGQSFQIPVPIDQAVFPRSPDTPPLNLFQERRGQSEEHAGLEYLFWKIEDKPAHVPELDDVRDDVVREWKSGRGADDDGKTVRGLALAKKSAEDFAEVARKQDKSLRELFGKPEPKKEEEEDKEDDIEEKDGEKKEDGDDSDEKVEDSEDADSKPAESEDAEADNDDTTEEVASSDNDGKFDVVEPAPFSWKTMSGQNVSLTENIDGLDQPGPDFMKSIFAMDAGDVGVAVNHPQTSVYVVRVVSVTPNEKTLKERFTRSTSDNIAGAAAFSNSARALAVRDALRKEFKMEWVVAEDQDASQ